MAIYFIQCRDSGFIKIGRARSPVRRLNEMQTSCWEDLILLAVKKDGNERALHARFAEFRHRGEWFKPNPELIALIEKHRVEFTPRQHVPGLETCSACGTPGHRSRYCKNVRHVSAPVSPAVIDSSAANLSTEGV